MASEADSGPVGKEEKRFIARAASLFDGPLGREFRDDLNQTRDKWAQDYPAFPLPDLRAIPEPVNLPDEWFFYPPALVALKLEDACRVAAAASWHDRVLDLCRKYWPEGEYPNWLGPKWHPATRYISACLLWEASTVPWWSAPSEKRIRRPDLEPSTWDDHPGFASERARADFLTDQIFRSLPPSVALAIVREAGLVGVQVLREVHARAKESGNPWMMLPKGVTPADVSELGAALAGSELRARNDAIRRLRQTEGMSDNKIAQLMGIDRGTVSAVMRKEV